MDIRTKKWTNQLRFDDILPETFFEIIHIENKASYRFMQKLNFYNPKTKIIYFMKFTISMSVIILNIFLPIENSLI